MTNKTTINLDKKTLARLRTLKENPHQTYDELILKLLNVYLQNCTEHLEEGFQRDIQQAKMRELWGDAEDDAWDDLS